MKTRGRKVWDISKTHVWIPRAVFRENEDRKTRRNQSYTGAPRCKQRGMFAPPLQKREYW